MSVRPGDAFDIPPELAGLSDVDFDKFAADAMREFSSPLAVSDFGALDVTSVQTIGVGHTAPPKQVFIAADYAQIEARVLAWLAGQQDILDVFARNEDVYTYTAGRIGSTNRQLGKVCVLGLGFGMGWKKFIDTAKVMGGLDLSEEFAQDTVRNWRLSSNHIVGLWYRLDDAFRASINSPVGTRTPVHEHENIVMERGDHAVGIFLPSKKRRLIYRNPRLVPNSESFHETKTDIHYDGVQQYSRQWGAIKTYGGKLAENVTQAVARDVMADGLLRMDAAGLDLRMTVHDEVIAVAKDAEGESELAIMLTAMRTPPPWAEGLPVNAEGWAGKRYRK